MDKFMITILGFAIGTCVSTGSATAEGNWSTSTTCNIYSPNISDQPHLNILANEVVGEDGKISKGINLNFSNIESLTESNASFSGVRVSTSAGNSILENAEATGRAAASGYILTVPLGDTVSSVLADIASGKDMIVTIPTDSGEKTFTVDLTGSGKAIAALRNCRG